MTQAYPLQWPAGRPRTTDNQRIDSRFKLNSATKHDVQVELFWECERMGGEYIVISTMIEVRRDGLPYANRRAPEDPGVAVYFRREDRNVSFACDQYSRIWENMRAITKTIEALRGIERWGGQQQFDRSIQGFTALPAPDMIVTPPPSDDPYAGKLWHQILSVTPDAAELAIRGAYRAQARAAVANNDQDALRALNTARDEGLALLDAGRAVAE